VFYPNSNDVKAGVLQLFLLSTTKLVFKNLATPNKSYDQYDRINVKIPYKNLFDDTSAICYTLGSLNPNKMK
jgi:hypothetical protein